jgi:hypothetical protein
LLLIFLIVESFSATNGGICSLDPVDTRDPAMRRVVISLTPA